VAADVFGSHGQRSNAWLVHHVLAGRGISNPRTHSWRFIGTDGSFSRGDDCRGATVKWHLRLGVLEIVRRDPGDFTISRPSNVTNAMRAFAMCNTGNTVWAANTDFYKKVCSWRLRFEPRVVARKHNHSVLFYESDSRLMEELARFVGPALGAGDSAIIIATRSHREALEKRLELKGFDTKSHGLRKRYFVFDAADTLSKFMVGCSPDPASFSRIMIHTLATAKVASENSPPQIVAFGEMVALLWAEGRTKAAIQLERLWNELAHTNSFSLLCAYPFSFFPERERATQLSGICAEHTGVILPLTFSEPQPL
jgi:hypothetical protein